MIRPLVLLVVGVGVWCSLYTTPAFAASSNLVISQFQTGGSGTGTSDQEFINLYNNADQAINITNWCVKHSSYASTSKQTLYCFAASPGFAEVHVLPKSSLLIASPNYTLPEYISDITGRYTTTYLMTGTAGHVMILDAHGEIVDKVSWYGTATSPPLDGVSAIAPSGGMMLVRDYENEKFVDTDENSNDFMMATSRPMPASPLIDYNTPAAPVDLCAEMDGIQLIMPDGYGYDEAGNCELMTKDVCPNIAKIQTVVPQDHVVAEDGYCYAVGLDICTNIVGFQLYLPEGYRLTGPKICKQVVDKRKLIITELLPNSSGIDTGKEFIELNNNDNVSIDLSDYRLAIGKNAEKIISLPQVVIEPGEYVHFYDSGLGYSLLNTTSHVELRFYDDSLVDAIIPYQDPQDDIAWALIDGVWQYTDQPTPGVTNKAATENVLGDNNSTAASLTPCPAGKYRNPLTNRCRNIEDDATMLAQCDADEYRNPETNRCRKIALASASLTPCAEGYERNPETNRCRKITAAVAELKPCGDGYERNPETNRCRKIVDIATQLGDGNDGNSDDSGGTYQPSPYMAAAVAGIGVAGFGVYEWRTEFMRAVRRVTSIIFKKPL